MCAVLVTLFQGGSSRAGKKYWKGQPRWLWGKSTFPMSNRWKVQFRQKLLMGNMTEEYKIIYWVAIVHRGPYRWTGTVVALDRSLDAHPDRHIWQGVQGRSMTGLAQGKIRPKLCLLFGSLSPKEQHMIAPSAIWMANRKVWKCSHPWKWRLSFWQLIPVWSALGAQCELAQEHSFLHQLHCWSNSGEFVWSGQEKPFSISPEYWSNIRGRIWLLCPVFALQRNWLATNGYTNGLIGLSCG